ncbi:class I histocompatibility antigen, F10 alpha chain-like [Carettochelys insculpta]|uniref:class I histocompatibility antigen, F10 alpha chain-like n=1 Tax=Carettochelys insculpta TaxID=44489 RepID=UPI003EB7FEBA
MPRWGLLLVLCGALRAPTAAGGPHRLDVLVTGVLDEDGTNQYFMIAKLDDVKVAFYSSNTREVRTTQGWVAEALGTEYLKEKTQKFWRYEEGSKHHTRWWTQLYNQSGGFHTEQVHVSCTLSGQALVNPRFQYAFDGQDFISFDDTTGTWVAAVPPAFPQKQRWEAGKTWTQYVRWYLKQECLDTLRTLLQRGSGVLQRRVRPQVSVSRRDSLDGTAMLSCHVRGSYPHPIHVSWMRDGEDILVEKDSSGILPNADSTYYTQSSLEVSPQEEDQHRYACRVEHSSLFEPALVWAPRKEGPLPPWGLALIVLAVLVLLGAIGGGIVLWRKNPAGPSKPEYALAATKIKDNSAASVSSSATDLS